MPHFMIYFFLFIEWVIAAFLILWICKSSFFDKLNDKIIDFFKRFKKG